MWLGVAVVIYNIAYLSEALKIPAMKRPGNPGIAEAISMT
jgi:hypothetical protein